MATMTAASINDLPDSDFAYIEPGGKVVDGKTEPRSLRHFPIHDAEHVRNALARLSQSPFGEKARPKVEAAARKMGIGAPAEKSSVELKAEDFTSKQVTRWLNGEIARRILPVPFYGPIPYPDGKGRDLDGEYFDERSDLFGPFPALKASRWRVMDWHHDDAGVPSKRVGGPASMKGVLIGEMEMDEEPEEDGLWADWWIRQGQARRDLVARRIAALERKGQPIYNSTQAIYKAAAADGHLDVWPIYRNTATTSPQNQWAVTPPFKGLLDDLTLDDLQGDAIKALLVGLSELVPDLRTTFLDDGSSLSVDGGEDAAKAGRVLSAANEALLRQAIDALAGVLSKLKDYAAADAAEDNQ